MMRRNRIRQGRKPENRFIAALRREEIAEPFVAELPYADKVEVRSSLDLPSPPQFNGTKFNFWSLKMKAYLRCVTVLAKVNVEEQDALFLQLIQQALYESLLHKIAAVQTSKIAMNILEEEFSERGSSQNAVDEKPEGFANQANHNESHSTVKPVDDNDNDEEAASPAVLQENPAIYIAEDEMKSDDEDSFFAEREACIDEEHATFEIDEVKLIESLPMGAFVFSNNDLDCGCAGILRIQPIAENTSQKTAENNEEEPTPKTRYDEEILSAKELQSLEEEKQLIAELLNGRTTEKEISAEINAVHIEKKMKDNSNKDAAEHYREKGSHIAVEDEEMCIQDSKDEEQPAESILQKWSQEEIKYYYQLMWQQATDDDSAMRAENSQMKTEYAAQSVMGITQLKADETWHEAIQALEELEEKKTKKKKKLKKSWFMKNRTKKKMKKKTRSVPEFRVWSKRKKKKLQQAKKNKFFANICKPG